MKNLMIIFFCIVVLLVLSACKQIRTTSNESPTSSSSNVVTHSNISAVSPSSNTDMYELGKAYSKILKSDNKKVLATVYDYKISQKELDLKRLQVNIYYQNSFKLKGAEDSETQFYKSLIEKSDEKLIKILAEQQIIKRQLKSLGLLKSQEELRKQYDKSSNTSDSETKRLLEGLGMTQKEFSDLYGFYLYEQSVNNSEYYEHFYLKLVDDNELPGNQAEAYSLYYSHLDNLLSESDFKLIK